MVGGRGPSWNATGRSSCRRSLAPKTGRRESRSSQRVRAAGMARPAEDARAASMRPPTGTSWRGWVGSPGRRSVRCRCGGRSPNTVADIGPGPRTHHASASCAARVSKRASVSLPSRSSESARRAEPGSGRCAPPMRRMRRGWTRRVPSRRSCLPRTPSTSCRRRRCVRSTLEERSSSMPRGGGSWRRPLRPWCSSPAPVYLNGPRQSSERTSAAAGSERAGAGLAPPTAKAARAERRLAPNDPEREVVVHQDAERRADPPAELTSTPGLRGSIVRDAPLTCSSALAAMNHTSPTTTSAEPIKSHGHGLH